MIQDVWDKLAGYNDTEQREPQVVLQGGPARVLQDYQSLDHGSESMRNTSNVL